MSHSLRILQETELIIQSNVLVLYSHRPDQESLKKSVESRGLMVSSLLTKDMSCEEGERALRRMLSDESSISTAVSLGNDVLSCVAGAMGYLDLIARTEDMGKYRLISIDSTQHLQLDEAAVSYVATQLYST